MGNRAKYRIADIIDAIEQINAMLAGKSAADMRSDRLLKAAYERFLEILSEAARHIPDELKAAEPGIEWRKVSDIGNHLRHAYHRVDAELLWNLHEDGKLDDLKAAAERMLKALGPEHD